jgi:ferredoxin-NADP reductase
MLLAKILLWFGILIGAVVLGQLGVLLITSLRRASWSAANARVQAELLAQRLDVARLSVRRRESMGGWNGTRKFAIDRIVTECDCVKSFYLVPHDKRPLPGFEPGQYLTFELDIPGERGRVVRCYSLSERPRADYYRITVKRLLPPTQHPQAKPGLVSNFFHNVLKPGDIVDVKAPRGGFHLDVSRMTPLVLLAAGVGITPMLSILNQIVADSPQREVWLYFGVRNGSEHIMKEHLETVARGNGKFQLRICYSSPLPAEVRDKDYHHQGWVGIELLKQHLPSNNYEFYICGPGQMMQDLRDGLQGWGVPEAMIHLEAFGPASVKKTAPAAAAAGTPITVGFSRTGRESSWSGKADSLLELALAEGVPMAYGCRAGNCGTCKTAIKSGTIKYLKEPGCDVESGSCLPCICVPVSQLILEA